MRKATEHPAFRSSGLPVWAWALAVAQWLPILVKAIRNSADSTDFYVFHAAASRLLAGESVYGADYAYFYPPLFAYLMTPFALLPVRVAAVGWALCQVPLFYYAASRFLPKGVFGDASRFRILVFSPLLVFRFVDSDVVNGNCNVLLLAMFALCFDLAVRNRHAPAGLVLATLGAVKLSPLFLVPVLAVIGRWRTVVTAALLFPVVLVVPFWLQSEQIEQSGNHLEAVLRIVLTTSERDDEDAKSHGAHPPPPTPEELDGYVPGQSIRPILHRWLRATDATSHDDRTIRLNLVDLSGSTVEWMYRLSAVGLAAIVLVLTRGGSLRWAFATGLATMLLISPYSRKAHFVYLLPSLFLLLEHGWVRRRGRSKAALLASWSLGQLSTRAVLGRTWNTLVVAAGAVCFSGVAAWVGLLLLRRAEPASSVSMTPDPKQARARSSRA